MRVRRLFLAALGPVLVLSFALIPAGVAHADHDVTIEIPAPPPGSTAEESKQWTPPADSVLRGTWKVVIDARARSALRSFSVAVRTGESGIPMIPLEVSRNYDLGTKDYDRIEIVWDTGAATPYNGYYEIVASASSHVDDKADLVIGRLAVDNRPAPPTGVSVALDKGAPKVSWAPNAEVDMEYYRVLRSTGSLAFKEIGTTSSNQFVDVKAPLGTGLRYQVIAVRHSVLAFEGIASTPSAPTATLLIPARDGSRPSQPVEIVTEEAAPAPAPVANNRVLPRRDLGFNGTLPYTNLPAGQIDTAIAEQESLQAIAARISSRDVYKPPFIASSLLLLIGAIHMGRAARRISRA